MHLNKCTKKIVFWWLVKTVRKITMTVALLRAVEMNLDFENRFPTDVDYHIFTTAVKTVTRYERVEDMQ